MQSLNSNRSANPAPLVSVCTCVYNMADKIHRVFDSMKAIDYPNIEHIIVNDGSTDNVEELIRQYINEVSFPVKHISKENGGKHTALNRAWDVAEGEFILTCDADDALMPHSIRFLVDAYYQIPEERRGEYWCVHGRCVTQDGRFVGDAYPAGINELPREESGKIAASCRGDKSGLKKRELLNAYRFPEIVGVTHIPEGIIWRQLNRKYNTWYTNELTLVNYVNEGGNLTATPKTRKQFASRAYGFKYRLMHKDEYGRVPRNLAIYTVLYCLSWKKYRKHNPYFEGLSAYRFWLALLYPIAAAMAFGIRLVKKIR